MYLFLDWPIFKAFKITFGIGVPCWGDDPFIKQLACVKLTLASLRNKGIFAYVFSVHVYSQGEHVQAKLMLVVNVLNPAYD